MPARSHRHFWPIGTLLSLVACTSLPPQPLAPSAFIMPGAWSRPLAATPSAAGGADRPLFQWWQRFDDPVLDSLIVQALRENTDVRTAQASLRQAQALRDGAAGGLWPVLSAAGSVQRNKDGDAARATSYSIGVDGSWDPDLQGARRSALRLADAGVKAGAASLGVMHGAIAAEVAQNYIQLRGLQERQRIARANLESQLETQQITQWRVQAGLLTSLEGEQATAAAEQGRAQIWPLEASIAATMHALAVLCGSAPAALDTLLGRPAPVPVARTEFALGLPLDTLRQRPDVAAAEHLVDAALARVDQANAARYPHFEFTGSLAARAATLGTIASGALARAVFASVSGPLFDGGAARAQVRAQQAALEQARLAYLAATLGALSEVEDALAALVSEQQRLLNLRSAAAAAANAALIAHQRFSSGLIDFQTVLETQRSLYGLQDAVAASSAGLSTDQVRLYKALGGGWRPPASAASVALTATP